MHKKLLKSIGKQLDIAKRINKLDYTSYERILKQMNKELKSHNDISYRNEIQNRAYVGHKRFQY